MPTNLKTREGRIVVGVDGSIWSYAALHWAVAEAASSGRPIETVTVGSTLALNDALLPNDPARSISSSIVRSDDPAEALLSVVSEGDLLVLGNSGRGRIQDAFLGAVVAECVRRAPCSVSVVTPSAALNFPPNNRSIINRREAFTDSSQLLAVPRG